jgi:hypothetical protein
MLRHVEAIETRRVGRRREPQPFVIDRAQRPVRVLDMVE